MHRAAAELPASEADTAAVAQDVALAAVHAYYRLARTQVVVETDANLLAWLDTLVAYNQNRVDEGVAAGADLVRAELERDRVIAQAAMHSVEHASAVAALTQLLNAPVGASLRVELSTTPLQLPGQLRGPAELIPVLPSVRAARDRLEASAAAVSFERSLLVRQVGVMVGLKQSAGTTSFVGGLSLPFPLLDRNRGEIARAKGERDAAAAETRCRATRGFGEPC